MLTMSVLLACGCWRFWPVSELIMLVIMRVSDWCNPGLVNSYFNSVPMTTADNCRHWLLQKRCFNPLANVTNRDLSMRCIHMQKCLFVVIDWFIHVRRVVKSSQEVSWQVHWFNSYFQAAGLWLWSWGVVRAHLGTSSRVHGWASAATTPSFHWSDGAVSGSTCNAARSLQSGCGSAAPSPSTYAGQRLRLAYAWIFSLIDSLPMTYYHEVLV